MNLISIHALREEGDLFSQQGFAVVGISIHALREEGDKSPSSGRRLRRQFLSTPSARRATSALRWRRIALENFYPRPPRGGRRASASWTTVRSYFYPRPPRGGRQVVATNDYFIRLFLSTPSARRATGTAFILPTILRISIHALREEGDCYRPPRTNQLPDFYPRPPRGGRPARRTR